MSARKTPAPVRARSLAKAAAATALLGVGLLVLAGCSANPTAALSKLAHLDSGTLLASGELPPTIEGVDSDIVPSSYRLLTEHEGTEFWVGVTGENDVCFVAEPADEQATGGQAAGTKAGGAPAAPQAGTRTGATQAADTQAHCVPAQQFGLHGATLRLDSDDELYWLHTEYMTVGPMWTAISPNIAIRD